jgi:hypothetical protein
MDKKILITGTGRCGTTFLIKLFSFLDFDTGFTKNTFNRHISANCNSGMELHYQSKHRYLKNPTFMCDIDKIHLSYSKDVLFIVPIRSFEESAKSRTIHKYNNGGLWNANNFNEQLEFYNKTFSNFIRKVTKYDMDIIFIDFDRMITDKLYLYNKLKQIVTIEKVTFEKFSKEYEFASTSSKPK